MNKSGWNHILCMRAAGFAARPDWSYGYEENLFLTDTLYLYAADRL